MGTRGQGHRDACVGTWDLGTQDEGLEDINCGTRGQGRQKPGCRGRGMGMIIAKVGGKCDISFFVKMCYVLIVIRVRVDFHCRVIFPCIRA